MQRCGLCSLLSRLLRRAMCVGSRRGSGESYYQELDTTNAPDTATSIAQVSSTGGGGCEATAERKDNLVLVRLIPSTRGESGKEQHHPQIMDASLEFCDKLTDNNNSSSNSPEMEARPRKKSSLRVPGDNDDEKVMIDQQLMSRRRSTCNGRFLTMHKRRRKKLTTRSLLQDVAILDDVLHGQVQCILNQVHNWRFNAFTLETVTGGRSLPVLCVHLFHWYGLLEHFKLDVVRLWKLFTLIEEGYHSTNPYHNAIHATDVTQAMHCFLQETKIHEHLEPLEIMAALIGSVAHDLDHPGVNQPFLIATSNHLAALYENTSVLENHHWRSAVGCLLESGVAEQIQEVRPEMEKQISSLILATDITRQNEFLTKIRNFLDTGTLDMRSKEHRQFILEIALKCADISNPCRPWDVSKKWSQKVCEEFFRQGDYERQLNLPITSLCDRYTTSVPKIQAGFFKFVVTPLFDEWHRFLDTKLSHNMMYHLHYNQVQWEKRVAAELAEETKTEISDAELIDDDEVDLDLEEMGRLGKKGFARAAVSAGDQQTEAGDDEEGDEADNSVLGDLEDDLDEFEDTCIELSNSSEILLPNAQQMSKTNSPVNRKKFSKLDRPKQPRRSSLQVPRLSGSRFDRRHSMPVNAPKIIILSTCDDDTDLVAVEKNTSGSTVHEEVRYDDSFSILSSDSDSLSGQRPGRSSGDSNYNRHLDRERPLSAETLVADLNIATMTNSVCANRLNLVMHGGSLGNGGMFGSLSKQLVRQQTFPPLQPTASPRGRYMSSAAELNSRHSAGPGSCGNVRSQTLIESNSSSTDTSSHSIEEQSITGRTTLSQQSKRREGGDSSSAAAAERSNKFAKLSLIGRPGQKENLDPSTAALLKKTLGRRRGSAPVAVGAAYLVTGEQSSTGHDTLMVVCNHHDQMRRGSMPNPDVIKLHSIDQHGEAYESMLSPTGLASQHQQQNQYSASSSRVGGSEQLTVPDGGKRRSSMPTESLLIVGRNSGSAVGPSKSSRNRKKLLRRRSSGGADILNPVLAEETTAFSQGQPKGEEVEEVVPKSELKHSMSWFRLRREGSVRRAADKEALLSRRRGSLPIEVLAVGHTGTLRH